MSCIVPSFATYIYDYAIDVVHMTLFEFAMLNLVANLMIIAGSLIY
jgi:hypothetical protein